MAQTNRIALSNTAFISYHKQHVLQLLYIKSNNDVKSSRYFIPFTQHHLPSIDNQLSELIGEDNMVVSNDMLSRVHYSKFCNLSLL